MRSKRSARSRKGAAWLRSKRPRSSLYPATRHIRFRHRPVPFRNTGPMTRNVVKASRNRTRVPAYSYASVAAKDSVRIPAMNRSRNRHRTGTGYKARSMPPYVSAGQSFGTGPPPILPFLSFGNTKPNEYAGVPLIAAGAMGAAYLRYLKQAYDTFQAFNAFK